MPLSLYPNGFSGGVSIRGVPIAQTNPGLVFWVSNNTTGLLVGQRGGSDNNRGTFDSPFATLNNAISQCVANRGDIIFIKPGHAESVASATALNFSTAGVAIIGLGVGSSRPTFTFTTANTATIPVTAANMSIQNCIFTANFLSIAAPFTLAAAKNFTVQACTFNETSSVLNFLNIIKSTGAANTVDGLTVTDSQWFGLGTTSVNSFVLTANTIDSLALQRNTVILNRTATAAILATVTSGILTNLDAGFNKCMSGQTASTGGCLINVGGTTSTGMYYNNYTQIGSAGGDTTVTTTVGLGAFENRHTDATGATGFVIPTADS
jgi:hypothetical protein